MRLRDFLLRWWTKWKQSNQNKQEIRNWNWIRIRIETNWINKMYVCYNLYKFTQIVRTKLLAQRFIVPISTIILIDIHTKREPDGLRIQECEFVPPRNHFLWLNELMAIYRTAAAIAPALRIRFLTFVCEVCEWKKSEKKRIKIDYFGMKLLGALQTNNEYGACVVQAHGNSVIFEIPKNYDFVFTYSIYTHLYTHICVPCFACSAKGGKEQIIIFYYFIFFSSMLYILFVTYENYYYYKLHLAVDLPSFLHLTLFICCLWLLPLFLFVSFVWTHIVLFVAIQEWGDSGTRLHNTNEKGKNNHLLTFSPLFSKWQKFMNNFWFVSFFICCCCCICSIFSF